MGNPNNSDAGVGGQLVAVSLDLDEYPSNAGEVAAISDQQLILIRWNRNELVGFKPACPNSPDCKRIESRGEMAWYRIVVIATGFQLAVVLAAVPIMNAG